MPAKKIKDGLVRKAKVKKLYDKIKKKEPLVIPKYYSEVTSEVISAQNDQAPASMELHPARQAMLGEPEQSILQQENNRSDPSPRKRIRKPKPIPFAKEVQLAQERKEEAERKRKAIQEARQEWQRNVEERERFRKAMAKARTGGKNGQRKLGRESKVLLEKVMKRMAE